MRAGFRCEHVGAYFFFPGFGRGFAFWAFLTRRANFVAGHSGNVDGPRQEAIAAARANPNVYLETCSSFRTPGVIEELVARAGADRVLFGSDTPLMDPRSQIGKIITAEISDDAKRLVLGENARRLLFRD